MEQLSVPSFTHHVLEVIQCLLTDSPEVLNIISQRDIGTIVKLLHTNGRDAKVTMTIINYSTQYYISFDDTSGTVS